MYVFEKRRTHEEWYEMRVIQDDFLRAGVHICRARVKGELEIGRNGKKVKIMVRKSKWLHCILSLVSLIIVSIEICGLLGNYTASCGNYLPTFRDNVSVPSSRVKIPSRKVVIIYRRFGTTYRSHLHGSRFRVGNSETWPVKMGPIRCPETSVNSYHTTPCNYPEENRFHQHRGGKMKSSYS
jgi:hypothetical protein